MSAIGKQSGKAVTAVELQLRFLEEAQRFAASGGFDDVVPRAGDILALWADTLEKLRAGDVTGFASRLDWVLKFRILQRAMQQQPGLTWASPEIKHLDHLYGSLDPGAGLYWAYERLGAVERLVSEAEIERFIDRAHPALADAGTTVDVRLFETRDAARAAMWAGTRRLILLGTPSPVKSIAGGLSTRAKLALSHNPHGGVAALFADCVNCAADYLMAEAGGPAWDREGFERLSASVRSGLHEVTAEVVTQVEAALRLAHSVGARLEDNYADLLRPAVDDMRAQLAGLIYPGFVAATGFRRLPHLTRYLRGIERRLDKLPENPARDAANMAVAQRAEQAYQQAVADLPAARRDQPGVTEVRWMLEELRVSLFAQTLGTQAPVSENRILAALSRLRP